MDDDPLDNALAQLRGTTAEVAGGGNPNHGPMAVEALAALGLAERAPAWAHGYRQRLAMLPAAAARVTASTWREALGNESLVADWGAFFAGLLAQAPWQDVLQAWLPRLVPAVSSAGGHGIVRVAHAVRALSAAATAPRMEELGAALAYWCSYYREFDRMPRLAGDLDVAGALARVPRVMRGSPRPGMPRKFLYELSGHVQLRGAVDRLAPVPSPASALGALSEAGARQYLANRSRHPLIFVHAVTVPAALRLLLPHLGRESGDVAFAHMWQFVAALTAAYGEDSNDVDGALGHPHLAWHSVIEFCVETGDAHSIKFVEACSREFQLNPSPVYAAAAMDWSARVRAAGPWSAARRRAAGIVMG
ncbi:MAG TPA: hypothetical protein VJ743_09515 [Albitalea sp.]|nr:hypothetical protein [Albitalea sp.]